MFKTIQLQCFASVKNRAQIMAIRSRLAPLTLLQLLLAHSLPCYSLWLQFTPLRVCVEKLCQRPLSPAISSSSSVAAGHAGADVVCCPPGHAGDTFSEGCQRSDRGPAGVCSFVPGGMVSAYQECIMTRARKLLTGLSLSKSTAPFV